MTTIENLKKQQIEISQRAKLAKQLPLLTTWDELVALPDNSIIVSEIEEYTGQYVLVKDSQAWSDVYSDASFRPQWFTFVIDDEGTIEIVDDFTPELPALLILEGLSDEWLDE